MATTKSATALPSGQTASIGRQGGRNRGPGRPCRRRSASFECDIVCAIRTGAIGGSWRADRRSRPGMKAAQDDRLNTTSRRENGRRTSCSAAPAACRRRGAMPSSGHWSRILPRCLAPEMAFICQCANYPTSRVRMLAWWNDGGLRGECRVRSGGYALQRGDHQGRTTSCRAAWKNCPQGSRAGSYLGLPIFSHAGEVIGHLACFDTEEMQDDLPRLPIFTIFAVRAGIEIDSACLTGRPAMGHA